MKFSIITVSFNSEKTIERTIQSVLAQTYTDLEYIIIDGASQDGTINIVRKYEPAFYGRLKWISEPDNGIYDAMNKGIAMAKGEIIGIVNSDDWLEPESLKLVNNEMGKTNYDEVIYTGGIRYHYNDGSKQVIRYAEKDLRYYASIYRLGINHPATFVPLKVYKKYGVFDTQIKFQADSDLICRFYYSGVPFIFIKSVLSNQSDGGVSAKGLKQSLVDYKYILTKNLSNKYRICYFYYRYWLLFQLRKYTPSYILKLHRT